MPCKHLVSKRAASAFQAGSQKGWLWRSRLGSVFVFPMIAVLLVIAGLHSSLRLFAQGSRPSSVEFTNVTASAGITFVHYRGNEGIPINLEIFGPGVCVADFDGDGFPDIYFVN